MRFRSVGHVDGPARSTPSGGCLGERSLGRWSRWRPSRSRRARGESETFEPPGVSSFDLPPIFEGVPWFDKYMLQAIVAVILVLVFWLVMANKNKMVPSKGQFIGETAYFFVRNSIARDTLGHDFKRFLPFLIALFSFILVNNLWGIFPFTLLPTASHAGWAYGLAGHGLGPLQRRSVSPSTASSATSSTPCFRPGCRCSCGR